MQSRFTFVTAALAVFAVAIPASGDASIVCPSTSLRCCESIGQALVADPSLAPVLDYLGINIQDPSVAINCTAIIPIAGHGW